MNGSTGGPGASGARDRRRSSPREELPENAKLRAQVDAILRTPVDERLRQIEAEANFFSSARLLDG